MKDIILIAMSTLPMMLRSDDFTVDGSEDAVQIRDCRSQLESVVRYYTKLSVVDEILIVGLCTKPTMQDKVTYHAVDFEDRKAAKCITKDRAEVDHTYTAWEYFKHRILISPESAGKKISFLPVPTEEKKPAGAINEAIRQIRYAKTELNRLFIGTHGGPRDIYLVMSAILSLLGHEGIKPLKIMGTEYAQNGAEKKIVDQAEAFDIFSFVTGINDLLETGDVDVLETFFGGSGQPDHVKAVVSAMKDVAYGTQLCDPDLYEKGLRALEPAIRMLEDDSEASSLLHIFTDQIREDYGRLLDGKNRTAIDIIRWCVGKKLYQQALTFLESRMPAYFYQMCFYYYDPSFNVDISRRKPKYVEPESFIFDKLLQKCEICPEAGEEDGRKEFLAIRFFAGRQVRLTNGKLFEPSEDFRTEEKLPSVYREPVRFRANCQGYKLVPKEGLFWATALPEESWDRAGRLLRMHKALKVCRNLFNHGLSEERPELEDIKTVIALYLEEVETLAGLCTCERRVQAEQEAHRSAEEAALAGINVGQKCFVNFSNHPSEGWGKVQKDKALAYGPIVDVSFPLVPGDANEKTIKKMAKECVAAIIEKNPGAVMCQGEFTLSFAVIEKLREEGILVLAACSERNSFIQDGKRITQFEFKRFREYGK